MTNFMPLLYLILILSAIYDLTFTKSCFYLSDILAFTLKSASNPTKGEFNDER